MFAQTVASHCLRSQCVSTRFIRSRNSNRLVTFSSLSSQQRTTVSDSEAEQHTGFLTSNPTTETSPPPPKTPFRRNQGLKSIKANGLDVLITLTSDIESKTRRRLLMEDEQTGPSSTQLREANRLRQIVEDAVEQYTSRKGALFCVQGEPIVVVDCEIAPDLKQARVFWTLPYGFLLSDRLSETVRQQTTARMQTVLDKRGGVLQGIVHNQLRRYKRPPRIRFVPAEGELLRNVLKDLITI